MTDKEWVIHFCNIMKLSLLKPTRQDKTILIMHEVNGKTKYLFDCKKWKDAKMYLQKWLLIRAA